MHTANVQAPEKQFALQDYYPNAKLNRKTFERICQILYKSCGIRLVPGKEELVRSRLVKRLRKLEIPDFESYLRFVINEEKQQEMKEMIDSLTTNKTSFFRENPHFEYMRKSILPGMLERSSEIRIWSAGCSTGQEPYSIAILLNEELPFCTQNKIRILATDISAKVLEKARNGEYEKDLLQDIPESLQDKYFSKVSSSPVPMYRIKDIIRNVVTFASLNLMAPWPMKNPFDLIFCRNVMIYFDHATQRDLVRRFYEVLAPGGYLLVGHSESLIASSCDLKYIQPATYRKE